MTLTIASNFSFSALVLFTALLILGYMAYSLRGLPQNFPNNTWVKARGTIKVSYHTSLKQNLPTLELQSMVQIEQPDSPYVYRVF